eukprot:m.42165 g.42165  ORF g.42165 m.42165 type:complete len:900 (+) comp9851_c0_seq1:67-2766(+)
MENLKKMFSVVFVLFFVVPCGATQQDLTQVYESFSRTLGLQAESLFEFILLDAASIGGTCGEQCAELSYNQSKVIVKATGIPELGYGGGYYLRTFCNMSFSWVRTGGNQVKIPSTWPSLDSPLVLPKKKKWSYYQNVVTESYSMWWWDWTRWQLELDWMLLHGVNIALAYVGQEQIYREVYNYFGVKDSELLATFDGPAFLAWSRGQGQFGNAGPLPIIWLENQVVLNQNITSRMRELGIFPILSAFQGNVPKVLASLYPKHNISNGWMDSLDPLFTNISTHVTTKMIESFGANTFWEADGWFDLQTGPWYEQLQNEAKGLSKELEEQVGCLNGFTIPTYEEGAKRAAAVFNSFASVSPNATWIYQGYPWSRVSAACDVFTLQKYIEGFVSGVPKDSNGNPRILVLDLIADYNNKRWSLWDNLGGKLLSGAQSIWCALENWGGNVHVGGDLTYAFGQSQAALAAPHVVGVGLTPEGIDNNPAYYELVLQSPWLPNDTSPRQFLVNWGIQRCGKDIPQIREAYSLLFDSIYAPGTPYLFCCSQPTYCPTGIPEEGIATPNYNTSALYAAWALLIEAAPICNSSSTDYDMVDIGREYLSMVPCVTAMNTVNNAAKNVTINTTLLNSSVNELLAVSMDVDTLLGTHEGFMLGNWLQSARNIASVQGQGNNTTLADFYEWNARAQVTTWAPILSPNQTGYTGPTDYARKEWSGLIKQYYAKRVEAWLETKLMSGSDVTLSANSNNSYYTAVQGVDCNFDDLKQVHCIGPQDICIPKLEMACNSTAACIGFNFPGGYLKKGCDNLVSAATSTFYFKQGHEPNLPSYGCDSTHGLCVQMKNGTHKTNSCDGECAAPPTLTERVIKLSYEFQHDRLDPTVIPVAPTQDPTDVAKELLLKYKPPSNK